MLADEPKQEVKNKILAEIQILEQLPKSFKKYQYGEELDIFSILIVMRGTIYTRTRRLSII